MDGWWLVRFSSETIVLHLAKKRITFSSHTKPQILLIVDYISVV
jgi:hypothetical protein